MESKTTFRAGAVVIAPVEMSAAQAVDHYMGGRRPYLPSVRAEEATVPIGCHAVAIDTSWHGGGTDYGRESRLVVDLPAGNTVRRTLTGGASWLSRYEVA